MESEYDKYLFLQQCNIKSEFDDQNELQNFKNHDNIFNQNENIEQENEHESGVESDNDFGTDEENWDDDTIFSIMNGSNKAIKCKTPVTSTSTALLCPSFSRLHFLRRFQPLWQENTSASFIEPSDFSIRITNTSTGLQQPIGDWSFDIWCRYSESIDPSRRESAANILILVLNYIEKPCYWTIFFEQIEKFMTDEKAEIIRATCKQIPEVAKFMKIPSNKDQYREFNKRIPGQLMGMLLKRNEYQKSALETIEQLIDLKLLKKKVIQNTIIPGLLFYLNDAGDKVYRYERIMAIQRSKTEQPNYSHDFYNKYENESHAEMIAGEFDCQGYEGMVGLFRDCSDKDGIIIGIFSILSTILANISKINSTEQFLTQFVEYITDPFQIPILKSRDTCPIREILAGCLAPLAKRLGTKQTDAKLLPIFQRFMREKPEVQCAALKQLADFISILSKENQELLLPELSQLVTLDGDSRSWRQRAEFAEQLIKMVNLFQINLVNNYICPFALAFSADRIAEVRYNGIEMLATVLAAFIKVEWEGEMPMTKQLITEIRIGFLNTRDWRRKQSFGRLLHMLIMRNFLDDDQFCHFFNEDIIALSNDSIANVRQYFCHMAQLNQFQNRPFGETVRIRLEEMAVEDSDMEIRNLAKIALGIVDPEKMDLDLTGREERLA